MTVREYSFDRFRWLLMAEEPKGCAAVRSLVMQAVKKWKRDYRFLAALWIFLLQRWYAMAVKENYTLCNTYGVLAEDIYNVVARESLSWKDYQAFGRVTDGDPINVRYQDALNDRL